MGRDSNVPVSEMGKGHGGRESGADTHSDDSANPLHVGARKSSAIEVQNTHCSPIHNNNGGVISRRMNVLIWKRMSGGNSLFPVFIFPHGGTASGVPFPTSPPPHASFLEK